MKKIYQVLNQICDNRWFPLLFLPIAACFLFLYSTTTSPFFQDEGLDSAIFKTMGLAILQGKTPYVDIFDHKGPILYLINALGQLLIPGRMGIFLIQILALTTSLFFLFRLAKLFVSGGLSFVFLLISLGILGFFFEGGNLSEEWSLPFIIIPVYLAMHYFVKKNDKSHPIYYSIIYGLCFGIVFFIRPNDSVAQVGGVIFGITIWLIYQKRYKNLMYTIVAFSVGIAIITTPIIIWFALKHAMNDLFYGLLEHNKMYSGGIMSQILSVCSKNKIQFFMFFVAIIVLAYNTQYKRVLVLLIPILSLLTILTGTRNFMHYYIVVMPYFMLFFVFLCLQKNKSLIVCSIALFYSTHINTLRCARKMPIKSTKQIINVAKNGITVSEYDKSADKMLNIIPAEEKGEIWNYNLDSDIAMLWRNGIVQTNKVTLNLMYKIDGKLKKEDNIVKKKPKWILLSEIHERDSSDYKYIQNNYEQISQIMTDNKKIVLYKRKWNNTIF